MIGQLETVANKVRIAISTVVKDSEYVGCELKKFPSGSCEVASVITGLYLQYLGIKSVVQSVGRRSIPNDINEENHVWLTINKKYIVDITADQFDDCDKHVIVSESTIFHNTFDVYDTRPIDFSYLIRHSSDSYGDIYSKVLKLLKKHNKLFKQPHR